MRCLFALSLVGCGFQISGGSATPDDAPGDAIGDASSDDATAMPDAAPDAPPPIPPCPADASLRLCFSFDQTPLPTTLANEGTAGVSAQLTDITRVARTSTNGAAQLGGTSSIHLPMNAGVSNILAIEVWFRADAFPAANGGRMGLLDSNVIPPNISLFFYRQDPGHTLRCGIGSQTEIWTTTLTAATWHYAACVCEGGFLKMYLDGTKIGEVAGNCGTAGALVADGLTIGSDNAGGITSFPDRLAGAIDRVRLWAIPRTQAQVTAAAAEP